jgi:WD40 repeat protein/predicted Ser/Thr protein kinase
VSDWEDLETPVDPVDRELFSLLAAWREATQGRAAYPKVDHLDEPLRRRWENLRALAFALDQVRVISQTAPLAETHIFQTPTVSLSQSLGRIDRFVLVAEIGRGGMGVVYEALDPQLNRKVALKVIQPWQATQDRTRERFLAEGQLIARLTHRNIIQIFEIAECDNQPYLVMEYVPGSNLHDWLKGTPMDAMRAASLVEELALGIEHAHGAGVLHRDLKPANVLLENASQSQPLRAKITDFGLATFLADDSGLTRSGELLGTPGYMSPEMAAGFKDQHTPAIDVYGLGTILYETLTGRAPFTGTNAILVLAQVRAFDPVAPRELNPSVPRDLETICLKCLAKNPRRRYPSAEALAQDLRRFRKGEPIQARPVSLVERMISWAKRNPATCMGLLVLCTCMLLVIGVSLHAANQANAHAAEMKMERNAAKASDLRARLGQMDAFAAKKRSDRLSAQLAFEGALHRAESGKIDRALFELLRALHLTESESPSEEVSVERADLIRAIRINLTAWSKAAPRLRYAFSLPGEMDPHANEEKTLVLQNQRFALASDQEGKSFWSVGLDQRIREWNFADGREVASCLTVPRGNILTGVEPVRKRLYTNTTNPAVEGDVGQPHRFQRAENGTWVRLDKCPQIPKDGTPGTPFVHYLLMGSSVIAANVHKVGEYQILYLLHEETGERFPLTVRLGSGDAVQVFSGNLDQPVLFVSRNSTPSEQPRLEAYDVRTGAKLSPPYPIAKGQRFVALSGGSICRRLFHSQRNQSVCVWDLDSATVVGSPWALPESTWEQLVTANDRVLIAQTRDDVLRFYDLSTKQRITDLSIPGIVSPEIILFNSALALSCSPTDAVLVTVNRDGSVRGWAIEPILVSAESVLAQQPSLLPKKPVVVGQELDQPVIELSPCGSRVFLGNHEGGKVFDPFTSMQVGPTIRHNFLSSVAFSPDGNTLASATLLGKRYDPPVVKLWNLTTKTVISYSPTKYLRSIRFNPDGRTLALAGVGGTTLLNAATGTVLNDFQEPTCSASVSFHPTKPQFVISNRGGWGGMEGGYRLWNLKTLKHDSRFLPTPFPRGPQAIVEYVDQGKYLAILTPQPQELRRYCIAEDKEITMSAISPRLMAELPDRPTVAIATVAGNLELWHVPENRRLWVRPSPSEAQQLEFSPDGKILAVLFADHTIRLFDAATSWPLGGPMRHPGSVARFGFTSDSKFLISVTRSGQLYGREVPEPMTGTRNNCRLRIQQQLGLMEQEGELLLLAPKDWVALARQR